MDLSLFNLAFTFHSSFCTDLYFLVTVELCLKAKLKSHPCPHCLWKSLGIFHSSCSTAAQIDNSRDIPLGMELIVASDNITNATLFVQPWGEMWKNKTPAAAYSSSTAVPQDNRKAWPCWTQPNPASSHTGKGLTGTKHNSFQNYINVSLGSLEGHVKSISPLLVLKLQNRMWGVKEKPLSSAPPKSQLRAHHTWNAILFLLGALLSAACKKSLYNPLRRGQPKSISSCKIKSLTNWRKASRQHWCQVALACSEIWA